MVWVCRFLCCFLFIGCVSASAVENVALFFNTSYVDSNGTSSSDEAYNLKLTLEGFGHTVTTFTGITAAEVTTALAGKSILAMPEMESGDLNTAMAADAKQVINDWVNAGGILIVMNDNSNRGGTFINGVFGAYGLQRGSPPGYIPYPRQEGANGTAFENSSASVTGKSATIPLLVSSLPSGALNLYGDGDTLSAVFYKSEGYGAVYFFAWDWYNAAPNGSQDAGWLDVLEVATVPPVVKISEISGSVTESGGTATFTAVLLEAPTANVTFSLASSDTSEGTISASSVTFTAANWNVPQTFTVTGVDDALDDDDIQFQITTGSTTSADANFNNKLPRNVVVTCVDNETPPTITSNGGGATAAISVAENQTSVTTVAATDPEQVPTFSISGGADQASFSIVSDTGVLTFQSAPDREVKSSYVVEVTASDGSLTDTQTITVTVTDVNDNSPTITSNGGGATAAINALENQTAVTTVVATDIDSTSNVTYSLSGGADQASFSIVGATGVLTFQSAPDREAQSAYVVEVTASDGSLTDTQTITVTITDVNDNSPVISSNGGGVTAAVNAAENQTAVTTVVATDADSSSSITYSITGGADQTSFGIVAVTGVLTFNNSPDYEVKDSYVVEVTASDSITSDTQTIIVSVTDVDDNAPVITSNGGGSTAAISVAENQTALTTVTATDADAISTVSYSISGGADQASFGIVSSTGVLTFNTAPDREAKASYVVEVTASDATNTDTQTITVTISDVNDSSPVATSSAITTAIEGVVYSYTLTASDADIGTTFVFSAPTMPTWLSINSSTGILTGTPLNSAIGNHNVVLRISDGVNHVEQSFTLTVLADLDSDGIPDTTDADIDGDGMPNDFENTHGLDPRNASDASTDLDGDGLSNLEEYTSSKNPTQDDVAPVVTPPSDLTVNSTELFTLISLGSASAVDALDGELTPVASKTGRFAPGSHTITWSVTDAAGNTGTATQLVKVKPLVDFSKNQTIGEDGGPTVTVGVYLNGSAADYPVTVPYTVSGTAINPEDHNLNSGTVTITAGTSASISFDIIDDGLGDDGETVIVTMGEVINGVVGAHNIHTVTTTEVNVKPDVSMRAVQNRETVTSIVKSNGNVVVYAIVTDPNQQDSHTYDWSASDNELLNSRINSSSQELKPQGQMDPHTIFEFDPSGLDTGIYKIILTVTDDAQSPLSNTASMTVLVMESAPNLDGVSDTDGDGQNDLVEGYDDTDGDGIPEYMDPNSESNVLPERSATGDSFLIETDPGLRICLGETALQTGDFAAEVGGSDIVTFKEAPVDEVVNIGGYFDFVIDRLPVAGQSVQIVIPQVAQIPQLAVYRKLISGNWITFVEDANNLIASAPGVEGFCPPPGDSAYETGLIEGYWCVQLTIEDGGPNDADGKVNQSVEDPGGVAAMQNHDVAIEGGGGGSIDPKLLACAILILGLVAIRRYIRTSNKRKDIFLSLVLGVTTLGIFSPNVNATQKFEVGFNLGIADGDESMSKLNNELASNGVNATVTQMDDGERTAYNLYFGYQYYPKLWVQLEYLDLGDISTKINGNTADLDSFLSSVEKIHPSSAKGFLVTQAVKYPINERLVATAALGIFQWRSEYSITGATISKTYKDSGTDFSISAGLEVNITDNVFSSLSVRRVNLDGEGINTYSAGIGYRF